MCAIMYMYVTHLDYNSYNWLHFESLCNILVVCFSFTSIEYVYFGIKAGAAGSNATDTNSTTYSAQAYYQQCLWWVEHNSTWSSSGCQVLL